MGKKFLIVAALVALIATPALAAVQNVKVGGDLKTTSVIRKGFSNSGLGGAAISGTSQNVVLSQVGLNVAADLTDNVSTNLRLVNERIWGTDVSASGDSSSVDLDTAYVTMKEFLYAPLTMTIGRQPLVYGNALIIGDGDGTSDVSDVADLTGGGNFDAVKGVFSYDSWVIDVFAAKASEGASDTGLNDDNDADVYGINSNLKLGGDMNAILEAYVFAKLDETDATAGKESSNVYVPGLRVSLNPYEGLNLQLEAAYQTGNIDADGVAGGADRDLRAYALQAMASFALPVMKDISPVLSGSYTYLSGEEDTTGQTSAWQPMYEDQNTGRIFDSYAGTNTNMAIAKVALEVTPMADVKTTASWYYLNQVQERTNDEQKYAHELDLDVAYAYTEDVTFGMSAGWLTGHALSEAGQDDQATQVLTSVAVLF